MTNQDLITVPLPSFQAPCAFSCGTCKRQHEATEFTKTQPVPARQKPDNANTESMFSRDIHVTPDSSTNLSGNLSLQIGRAN